ncbi:copia protein, partial [Tanacetum coccineum]
TIIGTKWVYRNKLDENGIVSRNKARLVAQSYNQQEAIGYDETYALVARLESIRILLAIACANDFKLYQMDVKSAFLNGFINEEVYVAQPLDSIAMWSVRASKDDIDLYQAYATQESMFSLKVHYVGFFTKSPGRSYVNGFSGKTIMYYSFLKPYMSLDNGLYALGNDEDVRRMAEYIRLGWKLNDANVIGQSSFRHEDGESSQPNTTTPTTQTDFANDFYSASDPFLGEDDFDPFFRLGSELVDATTARNECVDKDKRVALDDDQIHVIANNTMENE